MISKARKINTVDTTPVEKFTGKFTMQPFNLKTSFGLSGYMRNIVEKMIEGLNLDGIGYLTVHGRPLVANETLRRGGAHTDGNYHPKSMGYGGWKVGEYGPPVGSASHNRQFVKETGGIILLTNYTSCLGWSGEYEGIPGVGGDCSKIALDDPFWLKEGDVYYGNNHFIHQSLPVRQDVHRVMIRITLPEDHVYIN